MTFADLLIPGLPGNVSQLLSRIYPTIGGDLLDQLAKLGELKAAGVLTEAEFQAQKTRILSS